MDKIFSLFFALILLSGCSPQKQQNEKALVEAKIPEQADGIVWYCPNGEDTRTAIISGEVETWPNISRGAGMRVQEQYPETALMGHTKYIEGNGTSGAICQYYNHIGVVLQSITIGAKCERRCKSSPL